jgi:hypothetical protein
VVPVNPQLVSRRRGPAREKDDAEDARICCLLALDRYAGLNRLVPHGRLAGELRSLARDDERACRDQRRLLNRLRADLIATFPAALEIAGADLGAPRVLRLLQRWPTAQALTPVSREELIEFARAQRTGYLQRVADRVQAALDRDHFVAPPGPGQGRHDPAHRRATAAHRREAAGLGETHGRVAAGRPQPPGRGPGGRGPAGARIFLAARST